jgi:8-hydroxy-5-deazaflavin:NADPH oxidoreductase
MKIGILGTGDVGRTLGSKLVETGNTVMLGSRKPDNEQGLAFAAAHKGKAEAGTMAETAAFGEVIFNCTPGTVSLEALTLAGEKNLNGKILIDVANPLDFSKGMPPTLSVSNTTSLGEEIQNKYPKVRVVKAFNTIWNGLMVNPALVNGGDHDIFICGNDKQAKEKVREIIHSFGWMDKNIVDLGDISAARGTEMYLPLWLRIMGTAGNGSFNIKIVK